MEVKTVTGSQEWRAETLGPWERHRRDLDGGRMMIVATGLDGRWNWDLWGSGEHGQCLDMPLEGFESVQEAKDDADRVAASLSSETDEQVASRTMIEMYREGPVTLKLATIESGKWCSVCGSEIEPGIAAYPAIGDSWLICGSCAARNPDATLAADTVGSICTRTGDQASNGDIGRI